MAGHRRAVFPAGRGGHSIGLAAQILCGQLIGAGRLTDADRLMKKSWAYVPGFNLSFALLFYLFSNQLVGLFNKGPRGFLPVAEQEVASED